MILTNIKRIIKSALISFWRNRVVSLSSILVMTITLLVFGALIFSNAMLDSALAQIKEKVDINVYFLTTAEDEDILSLQKSLENLPEVESIEYVSREDALKNFREKHKDDQLTLQALDELEENPLGAAFNIQAKEADQYESIASFLEGEHALSGEGSTIIDKVNYYQNKMVIDRLSKIISSTEKIGFGITLLMVIMSIVITFNTVRLAIYISREEISVMRLVGASNKYVRGPFVVEGAIYGFIASVIALLFFWGLTYYFGDFTQRMFGVNTFDYYADNFINIFTTIVLSGVVLGMVSSYLAVRKYLKV
ncbi:cell division protein FtsX [Patescibacteria group bacterium]